MSVLYVNTITPNSGDTVTVSGSLTTTGKFTIGDSTSDTVAITAELTSSLIPDLDDTFDLGSSTKQWRNLYIDNAAFIDTLNVGDINVGEGIKADPQLAFEPTQSGDSKTVMSVTGSNLNLVIDFDEDGDYANVPFPSIGNVSGSFFEIQNAGTRKFTIHSNTGDIVQVRNISSSGNIEANSFTGSLFGSSITSSYAVAATSAATASYVYDAADVNIVAGDDINLTAVDDIVVSTADEIQLTTTSEDGHITLTSAHTAGTALHIDANANAGSIVDIDAGILDIDVTGATTIDSTLISLNGPVSASSHISASGFIGNLTGNATTATTSSYAITSSYALAALSSSYAVAATSATTLASTASNATFAVTASHALTAITSENLGTDLTPTLETKTAGFTAVAGREYIVNDADGAAIVLPNAVAGARITIVIGTLITSNTTTITAQSGDLLKGYAFLEATDAANNKTMFVPDGSDDLIITLNGSTKGGLVGDRIELVGISGTEWRVRATLSHTGTAATPFS